uniref:N-acetyltransferase n=1 Tax=Staphylococcus warneri TaxID=1292 RepID=UPI001C92CFF4
ANNHQNELIPHIILLQLSLISQHKTYTPFTLPSLSVKNQLTNQPLPKPLLQPLQQPPKSQPYTTILLHPQTSYFTQLPYQLPNQYHLYSQDEHVTHPLLLNFLCHNLTHQPIRQVKYP